MRVIGVDALIKLTKIHINAVSEDITQKIHKIFKPIEYTRIDEIVDIVFTAVEEQEQQIDSIRTF